MTEPGPGEAAVHLGDLPSLPEEVWLRVLAHALDPDTAPVPLDVVPADASGPDQAAPDLDDAADPDPDPDPDPDLAGEPVDAPAPDGTLPQQEQADDSWQRDDLPDTWA